MILWDAQSLEEVEAALAEGDEELREHIEEVVDEAAELASRQVEGEESDFYSSGDFDPSVLADNEDFIEQLGATDELASVGDEAIRAAVRDLSAESDRRSDRGGWHRRGVRWPPFSLDSDAIGGEGAFSYGLTVDGSAYVHESLYPDQHEMIPARFAKRFWDRVKSDVGIDEWAEGDGEWFEHGQAGYIYDFGGVYLVAEGNSFAEWARDIRTDFYNEWLARDPESLKAQFMEVVAERYRPVIADIPATDEELQDLMLAYLASGEEDDVAEQLEDLLDPDWEKKRPEEEPERVIAEVSKKDVASWGILKGVMYEEAPWTLVRLRTTDLSDEGRRMRHCVGDKGMGYIRAVAKGDIEIWSLRSRTGKPRFTLEVDPDLFYVGMVPGDVGVVIGDGVDGKRRYEEGGREEAAEAILQLKGTANRTPGYTDKHAADIRWPEEVVFWWELFERLGVDPRSVRDFKATSMDRPRLRPNPARSFDDPYRPARLGL